MPLTRKLQQLLEDLAVIDDPQERLALLVDRARRVTPLPSEQRTSTHRVPGCVSVVWLAAELRDGKCWFRADAESPVVRGLVVFLAEFFSGFSPATIAATATDPLDALGIARNLSPTRRNGLAGVRTAIRGFAAAHAAPETGATAAQ
jgi:cysteine desulfuration protein SufE